MPEATDALGPRCKQCLEDGSLLLLKLCRPMISNANLSYVQLKVLGWKSNVQEFSLRFWRADDTDPGGP